MILDNIAFVLLFFLPAGIANAAPVFANKIPLLNRWKTPIDFGRKFRGKRILGNNKTWRGLVSGTVLGGLVGWLVMPHLDLVLDRGNYIFLGAALGCGALFGDALESFCKRQAKVAAGDSWFPFDQSDYIIGGLLFSLPFVRLALGDYALIFALYFGLHLIVSYVGYLLHLKQEPI